MAKTVGKQDRQAVIDRDGACRACGLPGMLSNLLEADHIVPGKGRVPLHMLQCLCRYCNNAKNAAENVPELAIRAPEYDLAQVTKNQQAFSEWLDSYRAPSARLALRLAKREKVAKKAIAA